MTIFAGAFSLHPHSDLPQNLRTSLRNAVSRQIDSVRDEISTPAFYLAKVDIGAFSAPGILQDDLGNVTAIAGEALLTDGDGQADWNRMKDLQLLHPLLQAGDFAGLERSCGTFCGLHFDAERTALTLFVDKVGVRPLYIWVGPQFAVFATALRILEATPEVTKRLDVRAVTEISAFDFPLADRTPYHDIKMLLPGAVVRLAAGSTRFDQYWRWDRAPLVPLDPERPAHRAYKAFEAAIKRRQRGAPAAAAFLSGGLDSRAIVGGLHAAGASVYTVNYAPDNSQDQVFAKMFAEQLGVSYSQLHTNAENVAQGYRKTALAEWVKTSYSAIDRSGRPAIFWSGDGGSVALGHVYLKQPIFEAMQRGDKAAAVALFNPSLGTRILARHARADGRAIPVQGVMEELDRIESTDGGRAFHLFLMCNDQRRHLAQHFEDIDIDQIEFHLPFFDSEFLGTILFSPSEPFLKHRFYLKWLEEFPLAMMGVPWQAYPGHMPCPLPTPDGLTFQWDAYYSPAMVRQMERDTAAEGKAILHDPAFPTHLLDRSTLAVASFLTGRGWRNYAYLIRTARFFHRYWKLSTQSAD